VANTPGFSVAPDQRVQVLFPEAYVKVRVWPFEAYAGRRRETLGLLDTLLSSGSYAWSGNALPLPKIQIGLPEYWPATGPVAVKGTFAHGFFENSRPYTRNGFLHQKSLYVRLGRPEGHFSFHVGMNHQVQWGGQSPFNSGDGHLPSSLSAYWYVITARSVAGDSTRFGNRFDGGNRVGNHLGSADLALEATFDGFALLVYRQHPYEDGSLARLRNIRDGLNGVRWQNRTPVWPGIRIKQLTLEYLDTRSQGGSVFSDDPNLRGRDNYFNHNQFYDGWSYFGRGLGTPFLTANPELGADWVPTSGFTSNNRVRVLHLGIAGNADVGTQFEGKISYSWNEGTYDVPVFPPRRQLSAYLRVSTRLALFGGLEASAALAYDRGDLFDKALGLNLRLRKTWLNKTSRLAKVAPAPRRPVPVTPARKRR